MMLSYLTRFDNMECLALPIQRSDRSDHARSASGRSIGECAFAVEHAASWVSHYQMCHFCNHHLISLQRNGPERYYGRIANGGSLAVANEYCAASMRDAIQCAPSSSVFRASTVDTMRCDNVAEAW